MRYKGIIKKLDKIVISDPSYGDDVWCRYERNNINEKDWKVELEINDYKHKYEDGITVKGIEFFVLMSKEKEDCVLKNNGSFSYLSKNKIKETEIGVDTACISFGVNEFADDIKNAIDEWQPEFALKTLTDGQFGYVKEGIENNQVNFIWFNGFLDEDTGYTKDDIIEYLGKQLKIEEMQEIMAKEDMDIGGIEL